MPVRVDGVGVEVHLQRSDPRRDVDDPAGRWLPRATVATRGPESAARDRGPSARTRRAGSPRRCVAIAPRAGRSSGGHESSTPPRAVAADPDRRAQGGRCRALLAARRASASSAAHGNEAHPVLGPQLAELPAVAGGDDRGAHEAAEARTVGPEDDRHVAGEVDRADGVGGVVDVRRMQAGVAAVGARPLRARTDQAHAGARPSCGGRASRLRRRPSMSAGVRNSWSPCGPTSTAISHSSVISGGSTARSSPVPLGASSAPRCSTSPVRSARPACPPKPPSVNVERAAEHGRHVDAAAHEQVRARTRAGRPRRRRASRPRRPRRAPTSGGPLRRCRRRLGAPARQTVAAVWNTKRGPSR